MVATDLQIDELARDLIARHGLRAARVAAQQLNEMIDRKNVHDRDIWACVVHLIHEQQGPSPDWTEQPTYTVRRAPRLPATARVAYPLPAAISPPEFRATAAI